MLFLKGSGHRAHGSAARLVAVAAASGLGFMVVSGGGPRRLWSSGPQTNSAGAANTPSPAAARALEAKLRLLSNSDSQAAGFQPIVITDLEANSYLKYHAKEFMPRGVYDPEVHIHLGHVAGAAEVDFNELNQAGAKRDDWGANVLAMILKGKQRVSAKGKLETANGQGKVTIENVQLGAAELPDWLVSALLENYVQKRYNVDLTRPLILPDHVTRIELDDGRATFDRSPNKNRDNP
jgi:hypothetical protein